MTAQTMVYGWDHGYDIYVTPPVMAKPGLTPSAVDAASNDCGPLCQLRYPVLLRRCPTWVTASLVSKWAWTSLSTMQWSFTVGNKVMEFIALLTAVMLHSPGYYTNSLIT